MSYKDDYKRPGKLTGTPGPYSDWLTKQTNKRTRLVNVRVPHDLDLEWRKAIHASNRTQTEVLIALMSAYVRHQSGVNKEIDEHIAQLMEKREFNDRKVVSAALDDAIAMLKQRQARDD